MKSIAHRLLFLVAAIALLGPVRPALAAAPWVTPSLVTTDHVSEGVLLPLGAGRLAHVYRLDPGIAGDHVGDRGRIGVRTSADGGQTWIVEQALDPSDHDDRNATGFALDGDVHLLYREYDAGVSLGLGLFGVSSSGGLSAWKPAELLKPLAEPGLETFAPSATAHVPGRGWLGLFANGADATQHSIVSTDGASWDFSRAETLPVSPALVTNEGALAYLGDDTVLAVFRQEDRRQSLLYSLLSSDGGATWGTPTPIRLGHGWVTAPSLTVSADGKRVFLLAGERLNWDGHEENRGCSIRIFQSTVASLAENTGSWTEYGSAPRPWPSNVSLYGYPTTALLSDGRHLVVFTERGRDSDGTERANFFQFVLEDAEGNPDAPLLSARPPSMSRAASHSL